MAKHYTKKSKLKFAALALAATAAFTFSGIASACHKDNEQPNEDETITSKEDNQLLKNGNFEFYNEPKDAQWLISTPVNWTRGGDSSYTMSGIIGTSDKAWEELTDPSLAGKLDANNDLKTTDKDYNDKYVDYNGMKSSDILYKDTYAALNDEGSTDDVAKELIANPGTHYGVTKEGDGYYYMDGADKKTVYVDENGDYFLDEKFEQPISHVLMLHNYADSHNGIAQNYASVSVDLPANTAAEISVWVKTVGLKHSKGADVKQDKGANITVTQTVGSSTLEDFSITCINTEKLIGANSALAENNGWVEYVIYVNACDFASSSISLELGLGQAKGNVEGYAFFDDVSVTKYTSLDDEKCTYEPELVEHTTCTLSSDGNDKTYAADVYERNGGAASGGITDKRYAENFHYLIDLASESAYVLNSFENITAGLTVDADKYATATEYKGKSVGLTLKSDYDGVKLPDKFPALNTEKDLLAVVKAGYAFTAADTEDYELLNEKLASASALPKTDSADSNNMLVMLSRYGAAYSACYNEPVTIPAESYRIISFWLKTSDMDGAKAATVTLTDSNDKDNAATITLDTTDLTTDIDEDNKDIYDGWVQCFFFVKNETQTEQSYKVEFNAGNLTIKDTTVSPSSYYSGWVAVANMQVLDVDETAFGYTSSGDHTSSLTFTEDEDKEEHAFDSVFDNQTDDIENKIVNPANYNGVNGASSNIVKRDSISLPYDDWNTNDTAGLINRTNFENYVESVWYNTLLESFGKNTSMAALEAWNEIFGNRCYQPLVIVNSKIRDYYVENAEPGDNKDNYFVKISNSSGSDEYKLYGSLTDDEKANLGEDEKYYTLMQAMNYGYVSEDRSFSSASYTHVSVRVKVSAGAVAYVYLTQTEGDKQVLEFKAPAYSFYYDDDGNVLKSEQKNDVSIAEQRANVLYTARDDGLYEDGEGKLYANLWNYKKVYTDESANYFDAEGNQVSYDELQDGETYYADNTHSADKLANHYLVTGGDESVKVYEYRNGSYYYIEQGKAEKAVLPFDISYARYDNSQVAEKFSATIDARYDAEGNLLSSGALGYDKDGNYVADKWITVDFIVHTGNETKPYRLELWSGARDESGVENGVVTSMKTGSSVLFDYSAESITESNFSTRISDYANEIITAYTTLMDKNGLLKDKDIPSSDKNVNYYENLVKGYIESGDLSEAQLKDYPVLGNYSLYYYTFSWYDSAAFVPFNSNTAEENQTGYDYTAADFSETPVYLKINSNDSIRVFVDYGAIDQIINISTVDGDDTDEDSGNSGSVTNNGSNPWLLISSILLVAALLIAVAALLLRKYLKTRKHKDVSVSKSEKTRKRYSRLFGIKKQEIEEVDREDFKPEDKN